MFSSAVPAAVLSKVSDMAFGMGLYLMVFGMLTKICVLIRCIDSLLVPLLVVGTVILVEDVEGF